jgi:hypothetical protein
LCFDETVVGFIAPQARDWLQGSTPDAALAANKRVGRSTRRSVRDPRPLFGDVQLRDLPGFEDVRRRSP